MTISGRKTGAEGRRRRIVRRREGRMGEGTRAGIIRRGREGGNIPESLCVHKALSTKPASLLQEGDRGFPLMIPGGERTRLILLPLQLFTYL